MRVTKMIRNVATIYLLVFSVLLFTRVNAGEIKVTGYSTLFAGYTNEKGEVYGDFSADNYVDFTDKSHAGLQFNTELYKDIDFSLTMLMEGVDEFVAHTDWFYITYTTSQDTAFRYGRLKVPFLMISNYIDIGNAYPWVSPPLEVYGVNLAKSADGLEFIYDTDFFGSTFLFDAYVGTGKHHKKLSASFIRDTTDANSAGTYITGDTVKYKLHDLVGFETSLSNDVVTIRAGSYRSMVDAKKFNVEKSKVIFNSAGIIIDWGKFLFYSEYIKRKSDESIQFLFPDQVSKYVTVGYKISDFLPYVTIASIEKGDNKNKYGLMQESTALGVRYDFNPRMDVKFQATKVKPRANSGDVGRFGFFDKNIGSNKEPTVYTLSFDVLF